MSKLFKYWKSHIGMILVIIMLLIVQAYCDLELPSYTADIVDVGITGGGIEHIAPEKISRDTFDKICLFLTQEEIELFSSCYDLNEGEIYRRNTDSRKKSMKLIL